MVVIGRAMPVLEADDTGGEGPGRTSDSLNRPFGLMLRGAAGAVLDGWSRDTAGILTLGFPVFSHGRYAQDQRARGKVVDFRCRITLGGVGVDPGDRSMPRLASRSRAPSLSTQSRAPE